MISGHVPLLVVVPFEGVHIDHQKGKTVFILLGTFHLPFQGTVQPTAVVEARQGIGGGMVLVLSLQLLARDQKGIPMTHTPS